LILTHDEEESYDDYIDKVILNKDTTIVKMADMVYNMTYCANTSIGRIYKKKYLNNFPKLLEALMKH